MEAHSGFMIFKVQNKGYEIFLNGIVIYALISGRKFLIHCISENFSSERSGISQVRRYGCVWGMVLI